MKGKEALGPIQRSPVAAAGPVAAVASRLLPHFVLLMAMDLLARTGYQMGKSPVLPLFSESLGAGPWVSGTIVAVSTITGLVTSPLIGTLSDLYGRRRLLLAGTAVFAFTPFVYLLIQTPGQLLVVRLAHGFATAIYGPVLSALVADMFQRDRAWYMGWYRSIRTASYLLGPLLGGLVLLYGSYRVAWISVGALGLAAFVPVLALPKELSRTRGMAQRPQGWEYVRQHTVQAFAHPTLLALGVAQAALYLGLRANKAFLPLYGISVGINPAQVGIVFSAQVASTLLAQPIGGYLADRLGRKPVILLGLLTVAAALPLMVVAKDFLPLVLLGIVLGLGEAAVMPSVTALGTELSDRACYGSTLGMLDAMDNVGKALGPVVAGLLLSLFGYPTSFCIIAGILVVVAVSLGLLARSPDPTNE